MTKRLINATTGGRLLDCLNLEATYQSSALKTDVARLEFAAFSTETKPAME
ncbi:hypothetical protein J2X34_002148 [Rhodococcus sp. BE178]